MYYGAQDVFADVDFAIAQGDKIALVGANGAGKTTLLRIILGVDEPTAGDIYRSRGLRIGYLPQRPALRGDQTLYGEMLGVFADLRKRQQALLSLTQEMASTAEQNLTQLMARYAQDEEHFELAGGYDYENRIQRVLDGLGFGRDTYDWPIAALSGGQVTRALLARLLLEEPEVLLLDEPTNYLDIRALEWLESYLQAWSQSLLVVSHDRYFLDRVVTRVWDLNNGQLESYRGNYSHYVAQRAERRERLRREYEQQQAVIAKTEEFVRRYKAGQRSKEARGRLKRLNRMERITMPGRQEQMRWRLSTDLRSGDNVLRSDGASIGYLHRPEDDAAEGKNHGAPNILFETGDFLMLRGQCVALLGPNGSGKTTFLRTILSQQSPIAGSIQIGASIKLGYLPQDQDWLDPDKTVLAQVLDGSDLTIEQARTYLGRFLFSGDDVFKETRALSGGELARVALALLTLRGANFLLLDEPTTHLDVESQEILQDVLADFRGSIMLVSHDRYLIDALATHIWAIEDDRMNVFEGNYSAYVQERATVTELVVEEAPVKAASGAERRRLQRAEQLRDRRRAEHLADSESEIARIERELDLVVASIEKETTNKDVKRVQTLGLEYQHLQTSLAERLRQWEHLASAHEEAI